MQNVVWTCLTPLFLMAMFSSHVHPQMKGAVFYLIAIFLLEQTQIQRLEIILTTNFSLTLALQCMKWAKYITR